MDYKDMLEQRRRELVEQLISLKEAAKPVELNQSIGRVTRVDAIQQQQMALKTKKNVEVNIQLIDQALVRLAKGTYGTCLKCGEEIDAKRLRARPEAPFCTACQNSER